MAIVEDLHPGSYKRVPFLLQISEVSGGRKTVKHPFPNSDRQAIEDLGLMPRTFEITAIITSDADGENYFNRRDRLIQKLEDGQSGILIHPFYGTINGVKVTSYTLSEDISRVGDGVLNIVFEIDSTTGIPTVVENTLSTIDDQAFESLGFLGDEIKILFNVSANNPSNFQKAVTKIEEMADRFEEDTSFLQVQADEINRFSAELIEFQQNVTAFVSNPIALADSVTSLFNTVSGMYANAGATFQVLTQFFDFGENDAEIVQDTTSKVEAAQNEAVLNGNMQGQSLVQAYVSAAEITYVTVDQVDEVAGILEQQYQTLISNQDLTSDTLDSITDLRVTIQEFFDGQKLTASQIIEVKSKVVPARVLAYQYYGESTLGADLAELNEDLNVSFLEGDLKVFTS